jgi:hypothetical protein
VRLLKLTALAVLTLSLSILGCTRGVKKSGSVSLSFKASQVAKMSSDLTVLIVNVSGGQLKAPIYKPWDKHNCGSADCVLPPEFVVDDIPSGGEVFVQVLAVFEDSLTKALVFKYADANKFIAAGTNEISLTPTTIGGATTQAHVYGRYLNQLVSGVATGPTGIMEARFKPPASASVKADPPSLILMRTPMFAGWASFFALDGDAKFDYFVNGAQIMANINIAALEGMTGSNFLEVDVPDYERTHWQNGSPSGLQLEKAQKIFIGYIGSNTSGKQACYKSGSEAITDAYVAGSSGATALNWNASASTASSSVVARKGGGMSFLPGDASVCDTSSTEFVDHITFDHMGLRNGHDSVAGIRGPFRAVTVNGDYVDATSNGTGVFLSFSLLPGVANPTGVTSVQVYTRATPADGNENGLYGSGDGIQCSKLGLAGFTLLGALSVPSGTTGLNATFPGVNTNGLDIVLCPVLATGIADAGVKVNSIHPPAAFKIIGSDTTNSDLGGPGISPSTQLLKNAFTNYFHNVIFQAQSSFVAPADVDSAYVSVDDSAWQAISFTSGTFGIYSGVSFIAVSSSNTGLFPLLIANTKSVNVRFRVKLSASGITAHGPQNAELTSESIRLIGADDCSSPGTLQPLDLDSSTYFTTANLLNIGTVAGQHRFQMRWPGCTGANWAAAPLDYLTISGNPTPTGCFGTTDISRPNGLEIKIGGHTSCDLSSLSVSFKAPSSSGADNISASGSGIMINP